MLSLRAVCALTALFSAVHQASATCESYGIDFVGGGSYFINSNSDDYFTAVSEFSGCEDDVASNSIVDPNGDRTDCTSTPLTPDYTPETMNCTSWTKNDMYSGDWSILILSNNGDGDPIDYERDFSLTVGPQQTTTYTPTVTATAIVTAVTTTYTTTTDTITTTLVAKTTTKKELIAINKVTLTSVPLPSIQHVTHTAAQITKTLHQPAVATAASTATATCSPPHPNWIPDPAATIFAQVLAPRSESVSAKFRRVIRERSEISSDLKAAFVKERRERLAEAARLQKRAPDQPTVTVTATDSSAFVTSTITSTATTSTAELTTTAYVTSTSTPPVVTITQALLTIKVPTVVAGRKTVTVTDWTVGSTTSTKSVPWTVTITSTTTPASVAAQCTSTGGSIW